MTVWNKNDRAPDRFDEERLQDLNTNKRQIYLIGNRLDEKVRKMLVLIAQENGILGRRAINGYIKGYIALMRRRPKEEVKL